MFRYGGVLPGGIPEGVPMFLYGGVLPGGIGVPILLCRGDIRPFIIGGIIPGLTPAGTLGGYMEWKELTHISLASFFVGHGQTV